MDILIVAPSSSSIYQELKHDFSAIEPNLWAGLLANSVRKNGYGVAIHDMHIQSKDLDDFCEHVDDQKPRFVLFVASGQNPSASTPAMQGAVDAARTLRDTHPEYKIGIIGPHVNALPLESLQDNEFIDVVFTNEGVYALSNLLSTDLSDSGLSSVKGIFYRNSSGEIILNAPERIVPQELLSQDLPGVAFDLMPDFSNYNKPLAL